jgi:beta-lactamase class A
MLSTFKFPVALAVLHKVEKGELSLQQKIYIKKEELLEDTYSPFREKYPEGNIKLSLEDCIQWMMVYSDNNLTDILLRLIGGPDYVQNFINSKDIVIKNDEEDMHKDWDSQFINTITPNEAIRLLEQFYNGKILNKEHTKWLYTAMLNNATGTKRLKGKLPKDVKVAHRTGTSFTNKEGMTGAINDYGIIELSDKREYILLFLYMILMKHLKTQNQLLQIFPKLLMTTTIKSKLMTKTSLFFTLAISALLSFHAKAQKTLLYLKK